MKQIPEQYKKFPSSRYMGSKNKIITQLYNVFKDLKFNSALDLFSGSSSVSYLLKCMNKKVISNDFLAYASNLSKSIIQNSNNKLNKNDIKILLKKPKNYDQFVQTKFKNIFYNNKENDFIDFVRHNINKINNPQKKALAFSALTKACQKKQSRGIFTFKGKRYDDGRADLKKSFEVQFLEAINIFNHAVFSNKKTNLSLNKDFTKVKNKCDLVYLDPPYYSKYSDNEYVRRYHFIEGLVKNWKDLEIQEESIVKKFKKYPSMFDTKMGSYNAIKFLIKKYSKKIIVLSYSSNSLPTMEEIKEIAKYHKKKTKVIELDYTYSFGTQKKSSKMKNRIKEYIFIMK